jgi:hypothetical protein
MSLAVMCFFLSVVVLLYLRGHSSPWSGSCLREGAIVGSALADHLVTRWSERADPTRAIGNRPNTATARLATTATPDSTAQARPSREFPTDSPGRPLRVASGQIE